ncbi:MAG TPA: SRPBCC family protein [Mycobacteriales bacterium]|nr:SRPBCC family protein [Mycobacteriales bacterium]
MATHNGLIHAPVDVVWQVLADGYAYADWVVGTKAIRAVDAGWPAVGTSIHHRVGVGPLVIEDRTTVRVCDPGRRLELEAFAGPTGSARIAIELIPWGDDECVVVIDEHPLRGPGRTLHVGLTEIPLQLRHRKLIGNLRRLVERRASAPAAQEVPDRSPA